MGDCERYQGGCSDLCRNLKQVALWENYCLEPVLETIAGS